MGNKTVYRAVLTNQPAITFSTIARSKPEAVAKLARHLMMFENWAYMDIKIIRVAVGL